MIVMKKLMLLFCALPWMVLFSCRHNDKNISISYSDSEHSYSMDAWFSKGKTRDAELLMNERIGRKSDISFLNTQSDALFTLDDGSTFYLQKSPGHIKIKLDKDENSPQFCEAI